MRPFEYVSPANMEEASALLGPKWGENEILAGGTDLLSLMKDEVVTPKRLVNIKNLEDSHQRDAIRSISYLQQGVLRIGAQTLLQDLASSDPVRKSHPALAAACAEAASPQIRNMATLGGNLCQRPRCWYFRNGYGLLAMKDGKSLVPEGDNRYHAILGNTGPAKYVSPSSIVPVLIAYRASVVIVSGQYKTREVPLEKFFITPREEGEREHDLAPNEIIVAILVEPLIPGPAMLTGSSFGCGMYEVRQKYSFDWPLATASANLSFLDDEVSSSRIVMGHVAPVPWVSEEAAQVLVGKPINEQTAAAAADAAVARATPLSRNGYKVQLARVAVKRAILAAAKGRA